MVRLEAEIGCAGARSRATRRGDREMAGRPGKPAPSIERYHARLAAGTDDISHRRIIGKVLCNAEQLGVRLSAPRQPSSIAEIAESIGPSTSTDGQRRREGDSTRSSKEMPLQT